MARNFRPPTAAFARKSRTASSAGRPRSTGSSPGKPTGGNKNRPCKICCGSASTRFSGSTGFPTTPLFNETVELAKQNGFGAQAGFINAVLRGYLREADTTKKLLDELKTTQPALGWSHPEWLVARWQKRWGLEKTAALLEWNNTPPKTFARVNTLKFRRDELHESQPSGIKSGTRTTRPSELTDAGDLLTRWREENVEYDFVRRDWLEENLVFELKSHPPLNSLASFRDGWFYIQDPGTLLAVCQLGPQPGETILDFCAAPGGKTTFIAQLMNNQGRIVAQDVSEERLKWIQENCARLGVTCVETVLPSTLDLSTLDLRPRSG